MGRHRGFAGWRIALAGAGMLAVAANGVARTSLVVDLAQLGTTHPGFRIDGVNPDDNSGCSVSGAGDVNGDGLADLIVGAWHARGRERYAGESYVIFGKVDGAAVDLGTLGNGGYRIDGISGGDRLGLSVSGAGDVNGDGLADLVLGASYRGWAAGESYVVFGKATGAAVALHALGGGGFRIEGVDWRQHSGRSVSGAGDVNGDGLGDLVVGAPYAWPQSIQYAGESYVVFGKTDGTTVKLGDLGAGGFRMYGADAYDHSGRSVSGAGDVNGDGLADFIVGAPDADRRAGQSYVVFGKADGMPVTLGGLGSGGFRIDGIDRHDISGRSVSGAGDVNGDGLGDLIVGAPGADPRGNLRAGQSFVVFGKTDGTAVDLGALGTGGFQINGIDAGDESGGNVSGAGDVNGDGLADLIVGASHAGPGRHRSAGESYIVFGKPDRAAVNLKNLGSGGFRIDGIDEDDLSGCSVSGAGDVNGDGLSDLVVGAVWADPGGDSKAGESYVVFSPFAAPSVPTFKSVVVSGDAARHAIGIVGNGSDDDTPSSRCWIDFDGGSGPGLAGSSMQTVALSRGNDSVPGLDDAATTMWRVETNRTGWSSAQVMFRYTSAETAGLDEGRLVICHAPSSDGPWTLVRNSVVDLRRNRIRGTVSTLGWFAIGEQLFGGDDVMALTEFSDVWFARNRPAGFDAPQRMKFTGFAHDTGGDRVTLFGDLDSDGLDDVMMVTELGEVWSAINQGDGTLGPSVRNATGWDSNKDPAVAQLVAADVNGDGMADLVEARDGALRVGINAMGTIPPPTTVSVAGLDLDGGVFVSSGDFNGDGADDLFVLDNDGGAMSAIFGSATFANPTLATLAATSPFRYDLANRRGIAIGDFNGDGNDDVAMIDDDYTANVRVALANPAGTALAAPTVWAWQLGFHDDPSRGTGWWVFAADLDGDGRDDLLQNTGFGDNWGAFSHGANGFEPQFRLPTFGFQHKPQGPWRMHVGNAVD